MPTFLPPKPVAFTWHGKKDHAAAAERRTGHGPKWGGGVCRVTRVLSSRRGKPQTRSERGSKSRLPFGLQRRSADPQGRDWDSCWKLGRTLADREPDSHQHDKFYYSKKLSETAPFRLQEGVELGASLLFIHTLILDKYVALSHACQGIGYLWGYNQLTWKGPRGSWWSIRSPGTGCWWLGGVHCW